MQSSDEFKAWYAPEGDDEKKGASIAEEAFQAAMKSFTELAAQDKKKRRLVVKDASSMDDVRSVVQESRVKFETPGKFSKAAKWLRQFSEGIYHYSNILDVFVQHHPEYVSLVWGAMKLLFGGVVNHETTTKLLAKSLTQISECLPGVQLVSKLYPTPRMSKAIEELYSYILKFLTRAYEWYNEGKARRFIHSITQPPQLRYTDLLQDIRASSRTIEQFAAAASQAELREIHVKVDSLKTASLQPTNLAVVEAMQAELLAKVNDLKTIIISFQEAQAVQSSSLLDTNQRVSDIQLSSILTHLSSVPLDDPFKSYQYHLFFRKRRAAGLGPNTATNRFWLSPHLQTWSSSPTSALAVVKGGFASRQVVQDFCVDVIHELREANVPVLWALKGGGGSSGGSSSSSSSSSSSNSNKTQQKGQQRKDEQHQRGAFSTVDLLKYLTLQAFQLNKTLGTEKVMAWRCAQFQRATTPREWFDLFQTAIAGFGTRQLYIVVDIEAVDVALRANDDGFNIMSAMLNSFASPPPTPPSIAGMGTVITLSSPPPTLQKVLVAMYHPSSAGAVTSDVSHAVVPVRMMAGSRNNNQKRQPQAKEMKRGVSSSVLRGAGGEVVVVVVVVPGGGSCRCGEGWTGWG
ncbi:hypothetical protein B0T17DRAFT_633566 [Bombardia bombarda]|uniref:DUF7708 domain-containing protein n=1 Tax=Bombardia bombarda TaxID=252184 RepID=A0AA39X903_9PEZI|nr:hypothetical protein B0T17DRAFT_633566 [Bombardia bombarda]